MVKPYVVVVVGGGGGGGVVLALAYRRDAVGGHSCAGPNICGVEHYRQKCFRRKHLRKRREKNRKKYCTYCNNNCNKLKTSGKTNKRRRRLAGSQAAREGVAPSEIRQNPEDKEASNKKNKTIGYMGERKEKKNGETKERKRDQSLSQGLKDTFCSTIVHVLNGKPRLHKW